jgi:hypothetical protein
MSPPGNDIPRATSDVQYAQSAGTHVAFRVLDGPDGIDVVMVSGFNFPMELLPEDPIGARLLEGLTSIGRLAIFDRRGVGLSDPILDWERALVDQWSDDLRTDRCCGLRTPRDLRVGRLRCRAPLRDSLPRRVRPARPPRAAPLPEP